MSVFNGLKKVVEGVVDVVMVVPDLAADMVMQEWHDPDVESRTKKRLKRAANRTVNGVREVYTNDEDKDKERRDEEFMSLKSNFLDNKSK